MTTDPLSDHPTTARARDRLDMLPVLTAYRRRGRPFAETRYIPRYIPSVTSYDALIETGDDAVVETETAGPRADIVRLADVEPKAIEWLWHERIPAGMLTILDGDPGLGKSMLTLDLAARVSTGRPMPGETTARPPRGVVVLSAEDDPARTIRPRLDAAGADCRLIAIVSIAEPDGTLRAPTIGRDDLAAVEEAIRHVDAALLVVDPLMAYLPDGVNANRDHDVRRALVALSDLAARTGAAIVVVRHLRKTAADGNPLYRGGGSIGIIGAARAGLLVARDPDDPSGQRRIVAATKQNLAPEPPALAFTLEVPAGADHPRLAWHGVTDHRAVDLLRVPDAGDAAPERREAEQFLAALLAAGPVAARQVEAEAAEAGIAWRTVQRAKASLGVRSVRPDGFTGPWAWALPDRTPPPNDVPRQHSEHGVVRRNVAEYGADEPERIGAALTLLADDGRVLVRGSSESAASSPGRPLTTRSALIAQARSGPTAPAAPASDEEWLAAPPPEPTVTDEPASDEDWLAAPPPEPAVTDEPATIACADYHGHQERHRRTAAGWTCETCASEPGG